MIYILTIDIVIVGANTNELTWWDSTLVRAPQLVEVLTKGTGSGTTLPSLLLQLSGARTIKQDFVVREITSGLTLDFQSYKGGLLLTTIYHHNYLCRAPNLLRRRLSFRLEMVTHWPIRPINWNQLKKWLNHSRTIPWGSECRSWEDLSSERMFTGQHFQFTRRFYIECRLMSEEMTYLCQLLMLQIIEMLKH